VTRWLVTGAHGQLGSDLLLALGGADVIGLGRADLDLTEAAAVDAAIAAHRPDVVINAAAYTAVDAAETDEDAAYRVNALGPANLASALARRGGRLIHVSTDYVFAGDASAPYPADAPTAPRSAYGRTKLAGEEAVRALLPADGFVVRTAWVYGAVGANFVKTMIKLASSRPTVSVVDDQRGSPTSSRPSVSVVDDQRGSPTWSRDLARGLVALGSAGVPGAVLHCTNAGDCTWFDLARAIFEELGEDPARVEPTTTDAFPRPAPRPAYSVLSAAEWVAAGLAPLPDWRDALHAAFAEIGDALRA
jgi:dTDP-4-dehydrorhamnose reductase